MRAIADNAPRGASRLANLFRACHAKAFRNACRSAFLSGLLVGTMVSLIPEPARASGGYAPDLCEVLGWDPIDRKVFCVLESLSEEVAGSRRMFYFALDGASPCSMTRVRFELGINDSLVRDVGVREARQVRWRQIAQRLKPLIPENAPALPGVSVVETDSSLASDYGPRPRYRVRVGPWSVFSETIDVITYRSPQVVIPRVYRIPGRKERLVILAFVGMPIETGFEVQVPVVVGSGCPMRPVEWKSFSDQ